MGQGGSNGGGGLCVAGDILILKERVEDGLRYIDVGTWNFQIDFLVVNCSSIVLPAQLSLYTEASF